MVITVLIIQATVLFSALESRSVILEQNPTSVLVSQYQYSQRINSSCENGVISSFSIEEFFRDILFIRDTLKELRHEMGTQTCAGKTLSSLTPLEHTQDSSLHMTVLNTMVHLFIMKLDWSNEVIVEENIFTRIANRQCTHGDTVRRIQGLQASLLRTWESLHCKIVTNTSINNNNNNNNSQSSLVTNYNSAFSTPILRYQNCQQRTTRDCILHNHVDRVLQIIESHLIVI